MKKCLILICISLFSLPIFASSQCTGGQSCSTQNLKNDFRIYNRDGFGFSRNDAQVSAAGVTATATEVFFDYFFFTENKSLQLTK